MKVVAILAVLTFALAGCGSKADVGDADKKLEPGQAKAPGGPAPMGGGAPAAGAGPTQTAPVTPK